MITAWMLAATVFAVLLGVAAFCIERALLAARRPTRAPWIGALIAAIVWPLLAPVAWRLFPPETAPLDTAPGVALSSASAMLSGQLPVMPNGAGTIVATILATVWACASTVLMFRLFFAARALSRVQQSARTTLIDGHQVLITESLGPAVIGLMQPRVAVPGWFMQLDAPLRRLVLRHEREHCRSRDPQLVWLAAVSVALMPWNAGLWFLSRRLRLALEIDCDARTLRAESNPEQYGKLLLLIAQRQSQFPLSAMLAESTSHLSRRISAMQMLPLRRPVVRVVLLSTIAAGAIAAACSPRLASDLTGPRSTASPTLTKTLANGPVYFEYQVERAVTALKGSPSPVYPAALKAAGVEGRVLVQFVVDEKGVAELGTFKVLKTDQPEFEKAVREILSEMRFDPALIGNKAVKQLVQQPFMFAQAKTPTLGTLTARSPENKLVPSSDGSTMVPKTMDAMQGKTLTTAGTLTRNSVQPVEVSPTEASIKGALPATQIEGRPYFEFQVEKPVGLAPGSVGPKYPAALKDQGIGGQILVQFVVNEQGEAEVNTYKVLKSDSQLLDAAVKEALSAMRFTPALVGGKAVRQLVQQPFTFSPPN